MPAQPAPISVFFLIRSLELGGAERQLVTLARGLQSLGHRITVGVFYNKGPLLDELCQSSVEIVDLRKSGRWDVLRFLMRLASSIRDRQPDLLYSFLGGANLVAAAVQPFARAPSMVWSIRASDMDLRHYDWLQRFGTRLEARLAGRPDLIISNSSAGRECAVAKGFPKEGIEVVPNGIDTTRFRADAGLRAAQRAAWGLKDDHIAVGVLARLDSMKGHETFVRAAASAAQHRPEFRFLCIGEGPLRSKLTRLAYDHAISGLVGFPGQTEPVAALNALDIYCSSSAFGEGFSNAIGEAMACELPCVVTDVGDSARIVGDTGLVVPRSDPEALAAALIQMADHAGQKGRIARQRIEGAFSVHEMVTRTERLLVSLASGNSRSTR